MTMWLARMSAGLIFGVGLCLMLVGCSTPPGGSGMAGMVNIGTVHVEQHKVEPTAPPQPNPNSAPVPQPTPADPAKPGVHQCAPCAPPPDDCGLPCKAS